jgi:hypothetical protein
MFLVAIAVAFFATFVPAAYGSFPGFITKTGFQTPSGNIVCNAGPIVNRNGTLSPGRALACVLFSQSGSRGQKTWYLRGSGPAGVVYVKGNIATEGIGTLRYGRSWNWHGFRCTSRKTGLTCKNLAGHGFFLSRASQRRF